MNQALQENVMGSSQMKYAPWTFQLFSDSGKKASYLGSPCLVLWLKLELPGISGFAGGPGRTDCLGAGTPGIFDLGRVLLAGLC